MDLTTASNGSAICAAIASCTSATKPPSRIAVLTYEDRGRLRLGADRTFDFKVVGEARSPTQKPN